MTIMMPFWVAAFPWTGWVVMFTGISIHSQFAVYVLINKQYLDIDC
jgi:hypothetical protein